MRPVIRPLPTIHPRQAVLDEARSNLRRFWAELRENSGLTTAEELSILSGFLGDEIGIIAKISIRMERHGNADTPGGLE